MPLDSVLERVVNAAEGYAALGLPDLAWEELTCLTPRQREHPEVREMELALLVQENRWQEAIQSGCDLCGQGWDRPGVYIHTAYALHAAGRTAEAHAILLAGPACLRESPLYHYNMGCYLAVSGNLRDAEVCLRTAFRMDAKLRLHARRDPDLKDFKGVF